VDWQAICSIFPNPAPNGAEISRKWRREAKVAVDPVVLKHCARLENQQAEGQVVAFFDMDRTVLLGYTAIALALEWVRRRNRGGGQRGGRQLARELLASVDGRAAGRQYTAAYRRLIRSLAGVEETFLTDLGETAFERSVEASLYREARQIVRRHKELGHKVVLVTAATEYQAAPVARALGADAVYSTRLKVSHGRVTGEVRGGLCFGEGKVIAARRYLRKLGASAADAWFYSDSRDDLPLLKKVGHPVATNPSVSLRREAAERGWTVLDFSSRGKPNLESVLRTALTANTVVTTAAAGAASWLLSRSPSKAANRMTSWLGDVGVAVAGLEFEIAGVEHLDSVRPAIFTFNHQSYLDTVVMAHLVRHDFVGFCKQEVASNRILGPLLRAHGTIFVDRDRADQSLCFTQAREALRNGKSLVIAPEGTRSATGELLEFKQGAFFMARKLGVPIIPVVLHNVSDALPKGKLLVRPATIQVTVMPPLWPGEIGSLKTAGARLREEYREVMRAPFTGAGISKLPATPQALELQAGAA
jgi:putative phosphoserine phosphatase/1-acylglycerol-3-phosphate O-acyltransferase